MQFSPSLDSLTYKLSGWTGNSENGFHLCVFKWTFRHINMLTVITLFRNVSTIHYNLHSTVRCHTVNYLLMEQILYFFSSLKDKKTLKHIRFLNYMIIQDSCLNGRVIDHAKQSICQCLVMQIKGKQKSATTIACFSRDAIF